MGADNSNENSVVRKRTDSGMTPVAASRKSSGSVMIKAGGFKRAASIRKQRKKSN